jgi:L-fuculose-phosphate aldolase
MEARELQAQVAWACRILAMGGHNDLTLGHVSARGPGDVIYMKRSGLGLNEVTPGDVLAIDLDCRKVGGRGDVHLEAVLHTEAYRARPDVQAVAHTHPPYCTALGATGAELQHLNHDGVLFLQGVGVFEDTAEMITRREQGQAVARALGERRAVLLRNHGVLVVGKTMPWLVYAALCLERAARIQSIAAALGPLRPMTPAMGERVSAQKYPDGLIETYWEYLIREAKRNGFGDGVE